MSNGPIAPNTYGILQAIQGFMQVSTLANGSPAYSNVIIGGLKDYTDAMPVGVIYPMNGSVERYTMGRDAKIQDIPHVLIGSVVPYTVAATAMQQLCSIRDAMIFQFAQTATLDMSGPVIIKVVPNSEKWSFFDLNGTPVQGHQFLLYVKYQYTLPQGPQP
jgi:hypothetical protein